MTQPPMRTLEQFRGLEDPDSLILGNHDEFHGVQEISIYYTTSRELFDCNTMVVNSCFSTMVVDPLNDPGSKTMVECKQHLD
jgi:hypothetical protein